MSQIDDRFLPFTFFSTADMQSERLPLLDRMIASVAAYRERSGADVVLFLLLQRCSSDAEQVFRQGRPEWIRIVTRSDMRSLSAARNLLLGQEEAMARLQGSGIVGFPDDDCWYPDGTLDAIGQAFRSDAQLDFWFCRYGMQPVSAEAMVSQAPSLQTVISYASSNTIFFRANVAAAVGNFDETLGVGAAFSGGEDTDYAIRAYHVARKLLFFPGRAVGHREFDPKLKSRYFVGSLVAIRKHASKSPAGFWAALRKILVGFYLTLRGRMTRHEFMNALRASSTGGAK